MAHLGFTVDSSQALSADANFKKLIATSDAAERAAKRLSAANDTLGGGYDRLKQKGDQAAAMLARLERATGVTGSVKRMAADFEAYGKELDRLKAKYVPAFAEAQRYEAEVSELNRAHQVGAISAREHAAALATLDTRYAAAAGSADMLQAATTRAAASSNAMRAHTTNLTFQAQDIAMMTAMGQNPMMLALQQGSQVGPILSQMGGGKAAIAGIGAALGSLISPINLITLGVIGFGAAGIQALMSMGGETEKATTALERHDDMLDKLLVGYGDLRETAAEALEAALRLPTGVIASDLVSSLSAQEEALESIGEKADDLRAKFEAAAGIAVAQDMGADIVGQINALSQLNLSASSTRAELDAATVAARQLYNTAKDPVIKGWASDFYALAVQLRETLAIIDSTDAAIRGLERDINIRVTVQREFTGAMEGMNELYMDPRSQFDRAREQLEQQAQIASETAQSYGQAAKLGADYQRVLSSINAAEAEANEKANARGAKTANKPFDQWKTANDNFTQRIEQQRMEADLLGKSTFEIERQRAAFELLNQAKDAGIPITATVTDQINTMSNDFANSTVQLQQQQQAMSMLEGAAGSLADAFKDGKLELSEILDISINLLQQFLQMQQMGGAGGGGIGGFISSLFGGLGGGGGGGWGVAGGFSGFKGTFGIPGMATGGTVGRGGLSWVGEQGPELLSLPQGAQVIPNGPSMSMANDNRPNFSPTFQINGSGLSQAEMQRAIQDALDHYDRFQAPQTFNRVQNDPTARG